MIQVPLQSTKLNIVRCLRENYRKPILTQRKNHPAQSSKLHRDSPLYSYTHGFPTDDLLYVPTVPSKGYCSLPQNKYELIRDHYEAALLTRYTIIVPIATLESSAVDKMSDIRHVRK